MPIALVIAQWMAAAISLASKLATDLPELIGAINKIYAMRRKMLNENRLPTKEEWALALNDLDTKIEDFLTDDEHN